MILSTQTIDSNVPTRDLWLSKQVSVFSIKQDEVLILVSLAHVQEKQQLLLHFFPATDLHSSQVYRGYFHSVKTCSHERWLYAFHLVRQ